MNAKWTRRIVSARVAYDHRMGLGSGLVLVGLFLMLALMAVGLLVGYFIIKAAVKAGVLAAAEDVRAAAAVGRIQGRGGYAPPQGYPQVPPQR